MIRQRWFEYGRAFGLYYNFERAGEGLPMHSHVGDRAYGEHNVILIAGELRIIGRPPQMDCDFAAPSIINDLPTEHELIALEPGTEILNLFKHGKPAHYAELPASERDVTFESQPLTCPLE